MVSDPGPGMRGLVGVHAIDVLLCHPAQRLVPVDTQLRGQRVDGLGLPGRPGPAGEAALLDDAEQAFRVAGVNAPAA